MGKKNKKVLREQDDIKRANPIPGSKQNAGAYFGVPFKELQKINKHLYWYYKKVDFLHYKHR